MQLTVKELKEALEKVPETSIIHFQYIGDDYIKGKWENQEWHGNTIDKISSNDLKQEGWRTCDMPCETATEDCGGKGYNKEFWKCRTCENRNRYISASRCFIKDNQIFIDGHY